jgi:hypothetical protein
MSNYIERVRTARYRSPSGATFDLQFDTVERQGSKKAAIHELPQQDKSDVQDLGQSTEKIPLTVYFTGDDFDQQADAFYSALSERGPGTLQHPRYGDIPVLPLAWAQSEDWVAGLGRAEFKIEFVRVSDNVVFPITATSAVESVGSLADAGAIAATAAAVAEFDPISAADVSVVADGITEGLEAYAQFFADIIAEVEAVQAEITGTINDVTSTIDTLIAAPAALFGTLANLAALPARVFTNVKNKIDAYASMIIAAANIVPESYAQAVASIHSILCLFAGASVASTIGPIQSRSQAVTIADRMDDISQAVSGAIEQAEEVSFAVSAPNGPDGYRPSQAVIAQLTQAAEIARAAVLERAYSLPAEHRTTIETERTPIDLVAEFYGDVIADFDAKLEEFIRTNDLQGNELIVIPAGREVIYYV